MKQTTDVIYPPSIFHSLRWTEKKGSGGGGYGTTYDKDTETGVKVVKMDEEHEAELQRLNQIQKQRRTVRVELKEREGRSNNLISLLLRGCNSEVFGEKLLNSFVYIPARRACGTSTDS